MPENTELVYRFIRKYINENGFAPTLREIADGCFMGRSSVMRHLDRLDAWGLIIRDPGKARGMRLGKKKPKFDDL